MPQTNTQIPATKRTKKLASQPGTQEVNLPVDEADSNNRMPLLSRKETSASSTEPEDTPDTNDDSADKMLQLQSNDESSSEGTDPEHRPVASRQKNIDEARMLEIMARFEKAEADRHRLEKELAAMKGTNVIHSYVCRKETNSLLY